jgi:hypothetical protein
MDVGGDLTSKERTYMKTDTNRYTYVPASGEQN